ncbi:Trafficking protein particle complex subunit 11 [Taenia crassiceps]|uniref:Trafficking protein particle complex subunit 11 n=1 Tax=Taenia crassiceps TaxID=6207 RepID=A0ABR4QGD8_9CEST
MQISPKQVVCDWLPPLSFSAFTDSLLMEDIEYFPQELHAKPKCLIALTGLDVGKKPFHASVLNGFYSNLRNDHLALRFRNLPLDHPYSKAKPKHSSQYEWYLPKGLLKRQWMRKHLEELPAVVVVFFDLEGNGRTWTDKVKECARRVEIVRSNLISRATKLVVTLLHDKASNVIGDNVNALEDSQELCDQCQISIGSLFILQQSEFMSNYIKRLEAELYDMACNYYRNAAKRVKAHKSSLTKATQQLLLVRHTFKIAFFDELKQETNLALKHYRQAYNHLLELKMPNAHLLEFKVVAGFINFKICRISFQMRTSDAISQFQRHVEFFKTAVGMPELAYEHEAWLSKQYEIFGGLLDEATEFSSKVPIAQHPGLYFYEAGRHTMNRRAIAARLCGATAGCTSTQSNDNISTDSSTMSSNRSPTLSAATSIVGGAVRINQTLDTPQTAAVPTAANSLPEFFGQRAWRNAGQTVETTDPIKEREGILALQAKEAQVDHSKLIIPLFARASLHFDRCGAKRMRNYPIFHMAEEFYLQGEYGNALDHYSKIVDDFRRSDWNPMFTSICYRIFQCASKLQKHSLIVSSAIELLSNHSALLQSEKEKIYKVIFSKNELQVDWSGSVAACQPSVELGISTPEVVNLTHLKSCVEVKVQFAKSFFSIDEAVKLLVFIKSFTTRTLHFDALSVKLKHESLQDRQIAPTNASTTTASSSSICEWTQPFHLTPEDHLRLVVFTLDPNTLGSSVQVEAIQAAIPYFGDGNRRYHLCWSPSTEVSSPMSTVVPCNYMSRLEEMKSIFASDENVNSTFKSNLTPQWELFTNQLSAEILPKSSKLEMNLRHTPPLLCNEKYVILCQVLNTEAAELTDLTVSAMLAGGGANDPSMELSPTALEMPRRMGSVAVGQSASRSIASSSSTSASTADELFSQAFLSPCLPPGADLVCPIFVHCPIVAGDRSLRVDAHYTMLARLPTAGARVLSWNKNGSICVVSAMMKQNNGNLTRLTPTRCIQSKRVQLSVTPPFEIASRVLSLKHEPIATVITGRPFVLEVVLTNCSPWSIDIEKSMLNLGSGVRFKGACYPLPVPISLDPYESLSEVQVLVALDNQMDAEILNLGQYIVNWRRRRPQMNQEPSFPKSSISSSTFNLPVCGLVTLPYSVELSLPPFGLLHSPFTISYTLENKTTLPQELNVLLESTEGFAFCGVQLTSIRLLPSSSRKLDFTLLPLRPGYVQLPRFQLWSGSKLELGGAEAATMENSAVAKSGENEASPKRHLLQQLQSHIFVMPHREEPPTMP